MANIMNDEKLIRKYFGEQMWHFCRKNFPTILEKNGELTAILLTNFHPNKYLYQDITSNFLDVKFKNYIYSLWKHTQPIENDQNISTPSELLRQVGYNLFYCATEEDINLFKRYYAQDEELCTFKGQRLNICYVWFAVKDNALDLKREDFKIPNRDDEYGTSVISIQFTKDNGHILSIKNRYNHHVPNCDATFSNDLDNIVKGLTSSFAVHYGMKQSQYNGLGFEIPNYVRAKDGKYYKYNLKIDNIYYCPDNIIIDNYNVISTYNANKERYIVADDIIFDKQAKKIISYASTSNDFIDSIQDIIYINSERIKEDITKITISVSNRKDIIVFLDKYNHITGLINHNLTNINNNFLKDSHYIEFIDIPNVETIGDNFLASAEHLKIISLPKTKKIGKRFLYNNISLSQIYIPYVEQIDDEFLYFNTALKKINAPNLKKVGNSFLSKNNIISEINFPNLIKIGNEFLQFNFELKVIYLPVVEQIGNDFLAWNADLEILILPSIQEIGDYFLFNNEALTSIEITNCPKIGHFCLNNHQFKEKLLNSNYTPKR